jgi:hypothetical protein
MAAGHVDGLNYYDFTDEGGGIDPLWHLIGCP